MFARLSRRYSSSTLPKPASLRSSEALTKAANLLFNLVCSLTSLRPAVEFGISDRKPAIRATVAGYRVNRQQKPDRICPGESFLEALAKTWRGAPAAPEPMAGQPQIDNKALAQFP